MSNPVPADSTLPNLSRRKFLLGAAAGAGLIAPLGFVAGRISRSDPVEPNRTQVQSELKNRILVLGAGMAGLTAALALHRRGHDVQVLEYQGRVGGRLISVPFPGGQFTEGGGGHFRSNMPLVCGYINKFKLPLIAMNDGCPRYLVDGETGDGALTAALPWQLHAGERHVELPSCLIRYLVQDGIDFNTVLLSSWPDRATREKYDGMTLRGLLQRVGASDAFLKLVDAHSAEAAVETAVLALLPDFAYHFADRNLFRIAGGNERLPKAMAEILKDRVHLNQPVAWIRQTADQASVTTQDGREWTADRIISTIPFPVLRDMEIHPGLSPRKRETVENLEWSPVVKVYLQTRSATWLRQGVRGWPMCASDRPWERLIDITGNEPGGRGNAFFYLTGANARNYLRRAQGTRARDLIQEFRSDLPGLLDEVIEMGEFSWPDQPWIKAAFADLPVGGAWMIEEMQTPEGRLHFAGDFTTLKSGWVEGAIESGLRAARQIDLHAPAEFQT